MRKNGRYIMLTYSEERKLLRIDYFIRFGV